MYQKISFKEKQRILVVSDIHGELTLFKSLLDKCKYQVGDCLIILGDIIEKGSENIATLRYIMELSQKNDVYVVKGNCDRVLEYWNGGHKAQQEVLAYLKNNKDSIFKDAADELGITVNNAEDLEKIYDYLQPERLFMESLPLVLLSDRLVFAHAGVRSLDDNDARYILGNRTFLKDGHNLEQYVIVGHYPTKNYSENLIIHNPYYDFEKKIICIDGGNAVVNGQLNMLIIEQEDENLTFTHRFALKTLPSLFNKMQFGTKKEETKSIRWPNYEVEIKDEKDDMTLVSAKDGTLMWVKSNYLVENNGKWRLVDDYTNYYHLINTQKIGYIMNEDEKDFLVNIDGIIGWIRKN